MEIRCTRGEAPKDWSLCLPDVGGCKIIDSGGTFVGYPFSLVLSNGKVAKKGGGSSTQSTPALTLLWPTSLGSGVQIGGDLYGQTFSQAGLPDVDPSSIQFYHTAFDCTDQRRYMDAGSVPFQGFVISGVLYYPGPAIVLTVSATETFDPSGSISLQGTCTAMSSPQSMVLGPEEEDHWPSLVPPFSTTAN
jgi:hypothetical protein